MAAPPLEHTTPTTAHPHAPPPFTGLCHTGRTLPPLLTCPPIQISNVLAAEGARVKLQELSAGVREALFLRRAASAAAQVRGHR